MTLSVLMCVVQRRQTILTTMHLHYTVDSLYKWEGWMVTRYPPLIGQYSQHWPLIGQYF